MTSKKSTDRFNRRMSQRAKSLHDKLIDERIHPATKSRGETGRSRCDGDGDGNSQAPKLTVMKIGYQSKRHPADRTVLPALERVISH